MLQNNITKRQQNAPTFASYVKSDAVLANISKTLGSATRGKKFVASIISAVNTNKQLQECDFPTIVSAGIVGDSLNLSPSPQLGHYYMVPFRDTKNNRTLATFQLGYKGYLQLAIRSGQYKKINVVAVKDGELLSYNPFTEDIEVRAITDPLEREKAPTIGYYGMFELTNGFTKSMYWSKETMEEHAQKYSKGYAAHKGYTFWEKDFDGMAFKTILRQLISKWGIMSIEMQTAIETDMSFKDDVSSEPVYFDSEETQQVEQDTEYVNRQDAKMSEGISLV